jgi:hypothetical protein
VGAEVSMHADGQTDIIKLMVVFCKSANVPKNEF